MNAEFLRGLFGLDGKVALVTGASGGVGGALAHGLAPYVDGGFLAGSPW